MNTTWVPQTLEEESEQQINRLQAIIAAQAERIVAQEEEIARLTGLVTKQAGHLTASAQHLDELSDQVERGPRSSNQE